MHPAGARRPWPDLPIVDALDDIRQALRDHGRAVVAAPPGAGKSTIVPLALLDEPWLAPDQRVVMLEPRRLATRATARRMAALTATTVGDLVGYQTRDERRLGPRTRIEVVTEGVLTRRLQRDPELARRIRSSSRVMVVSQLLRLKPALYHPCQVVTFPPRNCKPVSG